MTITRYRYPEPAELAALVEKTITEHPGRYDQTSYIDRCGPGLLPVAVLRPVASLDYGLGDDQVCRTTACVAGWAVILSAPDDARISWHADTVRVAHGEVYTIHAYACKRLNLRVTTAEWLFGEHRTRTEVLAALEYLRRQPRLSAVTVRELVDAVAGGGS